LLPVVAQDYFLIKVCTKLAQNLPVLSLVPVCYRKNGFLTITDANLLLGRLMPEYFPKIFGPNENQPLDYDATKLAFEELTTQINIHN
jgi:N-methylhydantoinase A/oxoprolinase/acetone carboxylase beta subunit